MRIFTGTETGRELFLALLITPRDTARELPAVITDYSGFRMLFGAVVSLMTGVWLFGFLPRWPVLVPHMLFCVLSRFLLASFAVFLFSAMYGYFAEVIGGSGSGNRLFKILPYSSIPFLFTAPAALLTRAFIPGPGVVSMGLFLLFFGLWSFYLQVALVRNIYGIYPYEALAVCLIPWVISLGVMLLLFLSVLVSMGALFL